jgi:hypothetical protein
VDTHAERLKCWVCHLAVFNAAVWAVAILRALGGLIVAAVSRMLRLLSLLPRIRTAMLPRPSPVRGPVCRVQSSGVGGGGAQSSGRTDRRSGKPLARFPLTSILPPPPTPAPPAGLFTVFSATMWAVVVLRALGGLIVAAVSGTLLHLLKPTPHPHLRPIRLSFSPKPAAPSAGSVPKFVAQKPDSVEIRSKCTAP